MATASFEVVEVSDDGLGNLVVMTDDGSGEHQPHTIIIPLAAIASRMHGYGLKTPEEAIDAILREHAVRLHDLEIAEHGAANPKYKRLGGLAKEVTLTWSDEAKTARSKVLKTHSKAIKAEHTRRAEINQQRGAK